VPGPSDTRVIALSQQLRALPVHLGADKRESFRNPAGVAFKLQNIRQVATGRGMPNASEVDRHVWQELGGAPERVQQLVDAIAQQVSSGEATPQEVMAVDDDEVFVEGRVLTALHRRRERSPKLRSRLLDKRQASGRLTCDCCGDGPKAATRALALAGFEAHHVLPLAQVAPSAGTKLKDLALLCAVCHRLIHRAMHVERRWIGVDELRTLLTR
jgi:5-methylcytosine-specific restriction enzyme A